MELPIFQVDAFTDRLFTGNPAAVVVLDEWRPDALLLSIARENNLSETAFLVGSGLRYALRWFTPVREVDLCGHATLASAHVVFTRYAPGGDELAFDTASGQLGVTRDGILYWMDFPARPPVAWHDEDRLTAALGRRPAAVLRTRLGNPDSDKLLAVYAHADEVIALVPDMDKLLEIEGQGVVATARGSDGLDFVSRYFAPKVGVPEDPITGSTHCTLAPYWAERLGKSILRARQLSTRGGEMVCDVVADRVRLGGRAVQYLEGRIHI